MTELLLEMSRVGMIDGWAIEIYSDDHNPPHFHFGPIKIGIPDDLPKNVNELRSFVFETDQAKVTNVQLAKLLKMLGSVNKRKTTVLTAIQNVWDSFDILRPSGGVLNEEVDEAISEMLEVAGCNENERKTND